MKLQVEFDSLEELKEFIESITVDGCKKSTVLPSDSPSQGAAKTPVARQTQGVPVAPITPTAPAAAVPSGGTGLLAAPVVPEPAAVPSVPTVQQAYTLDDLARAGMTLVDSGRQADLRQLLAQFQVSSLPELPAEQYGTFATALRGLGAQI